LLSFQSLVDLLGRTSSIRENLFDYLAKYSGAQIKNLDIFLQEQTSNKSVIWGKNSFYTLIQWLGPYIGITDNNYNLDLPFRAVNGYGLGNVYTTFYAYIYDFGYNGMLILVGIMAVVSQYFYEKCKHTFSNGYPRLSEMIYGLIAGALVLSFFSNKFYELIFGRIFIGTLMCWIIYNRYFCHRSSSRYILSNHDSIKRV
jgi:oligosaccharide repeat unit polymerase